MAHTCLQKTVWEIKCCLASEKAYLFPTVSVGTPTHNRTCELSETAAGTARRTLSFVAEWGMSRKLVMQEKGCTHPARTALRHHAQTPIRQRDDGQERVMIESTSSANLPRKSEVTTSRCPGSSGEPTHLLGWSATLLHEGTLAHHGKVVFSSHSTAKT